MNMVVQQKRTPRRPAGTRPDQQVREHQQNQAFRAEPGGEVQDHPDEDNLHAYFSKRWGEPLTTDEQVRIGNHVASCSECAAIGKAIQDDDESLDRLLASPETLEDEANRLRSINLFRARLEHLKREQERMSASEPNWNAERSYLWLTESSESWLMTLELADVIPDLAEAVRLREIPLALAIVEKTINRLETIPLLQPGAVHLLAYCAWAIDYYGPHFEQVERAVARFRQVPRRQLTLQDFALLNLAEGLVKFHQEEYLDSDDLFSQAQIDADRAEDPELMTIVRYYRSRALWKLRSYDKALEYIREAIGRDLVSNNQARVAAMELVEGWLLFLKGEIRAAQRVLRRARSRLGSQSDAWVDLGNILSFQGRLHREAGPDYYMDALDCFAEAILIYSNHDRTHRNVARTHLNAALVYRLLARDLGDKRVSTDLRAQTAAEVEALRKEAFAELEQARAIYELARDRNAAGLSRLHSILALLSFDAGEFDRAEKEAEAAYGYAIETGNNIGMANARIIQSKLALEGVRGYVDATDALRLALDAVGYAGQTENRRTIARAYIREGHALLEFPYHDLIGARRCLKAAQDRVVSEDRDYLRTAITTLGGLIEKVSASKQNHASFASCITAERVKQDISAGYSLGEISQEQEEQVTRFVCAELCEGNITKAAELLKTGARKIRKAISTFALTEESLKNLADEGVDNQVLEKLATLKGREIQGQARFVRLLREGLQSDLTDHLESAILTQVTRFH